MEFNQYQEEALKTAIYPMDRGLEYTTLGLVSEAGEVAGKVKKIIRDKDGILTDSDRVEIAKELSDVLWYVATVAHELGYDLDELAVMNVNKLRDRANRGVLGGSGDNR
jgi:NTP pyrophosphatase (non-canonical NTP hydrolase)